MELGLLSPQEMERLHSVRPTGFNNANRNTWMFDPLTVCYTSSGMRFRSKFNSGENFYMWLILFNQKILFLNPICS